ncbi:MAG: hypothetical protein IKQ85_02845, partial [Bacteroidaceae bacterium]|nr:hypothetical protein [Bacteroidaceae bacterium]
KKLLSTSFHSWRNLRYTPLFANNYVQLSTKTIGYQHFKQNGGSKKGLFQTIGVYLQNKNSMPPL